MELSEQALAELRAIIQDQHAGSPLADLSDIELQQLGHSMLKLTSIVLQHHKS